MRESGPNIDPVAHESLLDALGVVDNENSVTNDYNKDEDMDLATFLIHRACNNSTLANYFCW